MFPSSIPSFQRMFFGQMFDADLEKPIDHAILIQHFSNSRVTATNKENKQNARVNLIQLEFLSFNRIPDLWGFGSP